jgi:gas vesicle protein
MEDDKKFSYFFLGLGIGVAVGILFAPKSGVETREYLKERADEGKDYLKRKTEELRESASGAIDRSKQGIQRQREQIRAAVDAGRQAYRETAHPPASDPGADEMMQGI